MASIEIKEQFMIGENDHGYRFAVGKVGERWVGYAIGQDGIFFFPMAENYIMGLTDRERAIKLTGAIAQSFEYGYGGVDRWFIDESLQGNPDDFTCANCGSVGCDAQCGKEIE